MHTLVNTKSKKLIDFATNKSGVAKNQNSGPAISETVMSAAESYNSTDKKSNIVYYTKNNN